MPMSPGEAISMQAEQGQAPAQQQAAGTSQENPILDAMRTMMTVVAAKTEQGDPNAPEMQELLRRFTELVSGSAEQQATMAPPTGGQQPTQQSSPIGQQGANIMTGQYAGSKAQTGRVAFI